MTTPRRLLPSSTITDVADRIVDSALACIERDGIEGLTVRGIARDADVNVAAVNYYFGSKDHLLTVALERALDRGMADPLVAFDALAADGKDARAALLGVVEAVVASGVSRPRTTFAHLHGPIVEQDYQRDAVVRLNALLARLAERLRREERRARSKKRPRSQSPARGRTADPGRRIALSQAWSSVLMASLAPQLFREFTGIDLAEARQRRLWVKILLDGVLGPAPATKPGGRERRGRGETSRRAASRRR